MAVRLLPPVVVHFKSCAKLTPQHSPACDVARLAVVPLQHDSIVQQLE